MFFLCQNVIRSGYYIREEKEMVLLIITDGRSFWSKERLTSYF